MENTAERKRRSRMSQMHPEYSKEEIEDALAQERNAKPIQEREKKPRTAEQRRYAKIKETHRVNDDEAIAYNRAHQAEIRASNREVFAGRPATFVPRKHSQEIDNHPIVKPNSQAHKAIMARNRKVFAR